MCSAAHIRPFGQVDLYTQQVQQEKDRIAELDTQIKHYQQKACTTEQRFGVMRHCRTAAVMFVRGFV